MPLQAVGCVRHEGTNRSIASPIQQQT